MLHLPDYAKQFGFQPASKCAKEFSTLPQSEFKFVGKLMQQTVANDTGHIHGTVMNCCL